MEIYTNIDLKSSIKIEDLEEIPSFVSERDARRLIYVNGKFYYGSTSTWNDVADTATVTASADGLVPTLPNDALKFLNGFGVWEIPLIDESILTQARTPITDANHDFTIGTILYDTGTTYDRAVASAVAMAEVIGVVSSITDTGYIITHCGTIDHLSSLIKGTTYFLSDSVPGSLTNIAPVTVGNISKPLLIATSATSGYFQIWRGSIVPESDTGVRIPVGTIIAWPTETPPDGYLICDGSEKSRTTYNELYGIIGTIYGTGTGTFKLPDYRGRFLRAFDSTANRDPDRLLRGNRGDGLTGNNIGTTQESAFEQHSHYYNALPGVSNFSAGGIASKSGIAAPVQTAGAGIATETRPKNITVLYCIKY